MKYTAGILGVVMYKVGQTPTELMEALKKENQRLAEEKKRIIRDSRHHFNRYLTST